MSIVGIWKIKKVGIFNEEVGMELKTVEEIMQMEETEEIAQAKEMVSVMKLVITEDSMKLCATMPPEAIAEAKAEGEEIEFNEDGTVTVQEYPLKNENGEFRYKTGDEGEIDGEEIDPWQPVEIDGDGLLVMGFMAFEKVSE